MDKEVLYYEITVYEVTKAPAEQANRNVDRSEVFDIKIPSLPWEKLLDLVAAGLSIPQVTTRA